MERPTASAVSDLESNLQAMLALKAPGISSSKVTAITSLCVANIQSESVLIQKIFTHFKKAPPTHKLGVLYIVDSVTRKWTDLARAQGQTINSSAADGTFAAGVNRVTELMPVLMNDIIGSAPESQKEKIKKLVDIWDKGSTFPEKMMDAFKARLAASSAPNESTTPPGSPPPGALLNFGSMPSAPVPPAPAAASPPDTAAIFQALANMARQTPSTPSTSSTLQGPVQSQAPPSYGPQTTYNLPPAQLGFGQAGQPGPAPPLALNQGMNMPPFAVAPAPQAPLPMPLPGFPGGPSVAPNAAPPQNAASDAQVLLIKALLDQGIPVAQIPAVLQSISAATATAAPAQSFPPTQAAAFPGMQPWAGVAGLPLQTENHGLPVSLDGVRSPPRYRARSRSRSPGRNRDSHASPRGREDGYGRGGQGYRQRSPHGRRQGSVSPHRDLSQPMEKWVQFDPSIPEGHIKVLSRTLFVGGVTVPDRELQAVFSKHGRVQSVIVNKEKRHAFVKMITREEATRTKRAMDDAGPESPFRTKWGVGFGPRDNCDYSKGISIIPLQKLTDADRKWILTAQYGGSGGQPISAGMVIEEPDIEIGGGISSKAISGRVTADKDSANGRRGSQNKGNEEHLSRWRRNRGGGQGGNKHERNERQHEAEKQQDSANIQFGYQTRSNAVPVYPPGYSFPGPDSRSY